MKVWEFEEKVWDIEGIRIVVRCPSETKVSDYDYQNAAQDSWRITQLLEGRIQPNIKEMEVIVLHGDGKQPHGKVTLRRIRQSYYE